MNGRFCAAVFAIFVLAFVSIAPLARADEVKGITAAPASQEAQTATTKNTAVVSKGLTTATVTVPPSTEAQTYEIPVKDIMDALMPIILAGVGSIIALGFAIARSWIKAKFNVEVDKRFADQFQMAATNAAGLLIAKGAAKMDGAAVSVHNQMLADAANDLITRFPEAIKHFDITPERVQEVILGKMPQILNTTGLPPVDVTKPA